jgi:uncharacterized NAD(P)/FAD-binding protein YdhS
MTRIAVVGGGATGALAAVHLARVLDVRAGGIDISVIDPAAEIGRGLAYTTRDPGHLLNVRVANMSAFADEPDHLFRWLERQGSLRGSDCPTPFCFIPRTIYGAYLADLVRELGEKGVTRHVRDRCVDLVEEDDQVILSLESGNTIAAEAVVLATGNETKRTLSGIPTIQPWAADTLSEIEPDAPILIVGTGLTMIDFVLSLDRQGHRGKITALSHRGRLPVGHRPVAASALSSHEVPFAAELSEITRWLRGLSRELMRQGGDWRSAVDALRPHTQKLWRSMSIEQKRRFLRHARAYWDTLRHRMAPQVETQINALRAAGRLEVVAGKIVKAETENGDIVINIRRRGGVQVETCRFASVIDCTGLSGHPDSSQNPLIRALLARGAAQSDPLGIGLDISEDYALVDRSSKRSRRVLALGPLTRAAFWECTAIPDIRVQCGHVAQRVATLLKSHDAGVAARAVDHNAPDLAASCA